MQWLLRLWLLLLLLLLAPAACRAQPPLAAPPPATPPPLPTETAVSPSKTLTICMSQEPDTLYPHATTMATAQAINMAIYEPNLTSRAYAWQPHGLESLPTLENGEARLETAVVQTGDTILNAAGDVVTLQPNMEIINDQGETILFSGKPVPMSQLVVDFTMKPRIWADGVPVTAVDSVFSFNLLADPNTPASKFSVSRTASYRATGEQTTRWVGLPGFMDATYFTNFSPPLPHHQLGSLTAAELLKEPAANRLPLGDGPFKIVAWEPGSHIELQRNEHYYRTAAGFPRLDTIIFKFVDDSNQALAQLLSGNCHIVTQDSLSVEQADFLLAAEADGRLTAHFSSGTVFEHIDFGINSAGDYGDGSGRPDWFEDVRVRQAMALCTNRQGMVDNILYGRSTVIHSYIPPIHPLYPDHGLADWPYDVVAANRLLDTVGYVDSDGDGIREDVDGKRPFSITLITTTGSPMRQQISQIFQANMRNCGIDITLRYLPPQELFSDDSLLFNRQFDLVEFAWITSINPPCELFLSDHASAALNTTNRNPNTSRNNRNITGWHHPAFDTACKQALSSLPGTPEFNTAHQEAQRIWARELPIIPLFPRLQMAATRPEVYGFQLDPTENSGMVDLYRIDLIPK